MHRTEAPYDNCPDLDEAIGRVREACDARGVYHGDNRGPNHDNTSSRAWKAKQKKELESGKGRPPSNSPRSDKPKGLCMI